MRSPQGRSTATPGGTTLNVDGLEVYGRFPRLLVWVKGGADNRRQWARAMRHWALAYERATDAGEGIPCDSRGEGYQLAYVVYGMPASLRALLESGPDFLAERPVFVMDAKPPLRSSGAGEEKYRPRGTGGEVDATPFPWPGGPIG